VAWSAAPGSAYGSIDSLAGNFPHLAELLAGVQAKGADAFADLLRTVDATLWSIDPLGARDDQYLSVFIGRPLALVRTRLQYTLDGPALSDPSWRFTFDPARSDVPGYDFALRLGALTSSQDGLVGYCAADYETFYSAAPPAGSSSYVERIAPQNFPRLHFDGASLDYLTMLVDPRAAVHVYTDILPVGALMVPDRFVAPALNAMALTFRAGPLLADLQVPADGDAISIVVPLPAEKNGSWSWVELGPDGSSSTRDIAPADQSASFSTAPPVLHSGWFQLAPSPPPAPKEDR
jgi:hypothetical protein